MSDTLMAQKRAALLKRWLDAVMDAYPSDTARVLRRGGDRFANPAAHLITDAIPRLLEAIECGLVREQVEPPLEAVLKLRALQDFTPAQAVDFVVVAKRILKEVLTPERLAADEAKAYADAIARVDEMLLIAFDVYMRCREKVYEVRYEQLKKMNYTILERANRMGLPRRARNEEQAQREDGGAGAPTDEGDEK